MGVKGEGAKDGSLIPTYINGLDNEAADRGQSSRLGHSVMTVFLWATSALSFQCAIKRQTDYRVFPFVTKLSIFIITFLQAIISPTLY